MKKLWVLALFNAVVVTFAVILTVRTVINPYPWLPIVSMALFFADFLIIRSIFVNKS
jgi:hypothetical protein